MTKQAACVLVFNAEGKVLAVTRRDDFNEWSLPGGKVEEGMTPTVYDSPQGFYEYGSM